MRFFTAFALAAFLCATAPAFAQSGGSMPSCSAGDPVVWVNTSSKVYHMQGDQYYGKTKHGKYECKSAADASGNHASGQKSGSSGTSSKHASASPAPAASGSASTSKHHHRSSKSAASPAPAASPSTSSKHHHHSSKSKASPAPSAT
jgi:hypothetical protein